MLYNDETAIMSYGEEESPVVVYTYDEQTAIGGEPKNQIMKLIADKDYDLDQIFVSEIIRDNISI